MGEDKTSTTHYKLLSPEVWEPPQSHKRLCADRFAGAYTPNLELLDEMGVISVIDWGGNP